MSMENTMNKKLNGWGGRFVLLVAALSFAGGLRADTATVDGYTYTYSVTDGKATIGSDKAESPAISPYPVGTVTIPSELGGYPVVGLGTNALYKCMNLTEVVLPDSVTTIGRLAFGSCTRLTTLSIPNSVTNIHGQAFYRCYRLESFSVAPDNTAFSSQDGLLLSKDRTVLIQGISGRVDIPPCVVRIGDCAFYNGSLTEVTIPSSVTNIGQNAFYECDSIRNVVIPDGVTKIENWTFNRCSGLTSVSLPNSVMHIGDAAFYQCYNLEDVTIPAGVTNIGNLAFYMCPKLMSLSIPESVRRLGGGVFYGCSGLTDVQIPANVTQIEWEAFRGCSGLTGVSIPNSVTRIGRLAFSECTGLTHVVIPDSVKAIDSKVFGGCTNLTNVWVPGHLKGVLPSDTFEGCNEALTVNYYDNSYTVTFQQDGETVESRQCPEGAPLDVLLPTPPTRDGYAFEGWWTAADGEQVTGETVVTNDVTYYAKWRGTATVDDYTYTYSVLNGQAEIGTSNALTTAVSPKPTGHVTVPSSLGGFPVVGIGTYAFRDCDGLVDVTIPNGVTTIGVGVFAECPKLTKIVVDPENVNYTSQNSLLLTKDGRTLVQGVNGEVVIPLSVRMIGTRAFQGCRGLTRLVIPNSVTNIGFYSFAYYRGLTDVTIPDGIQFVGGYAFGLCGRLANVTLPAYLVERSNPWSPYVGEVFEGTSIENVALAEGTTVIGPSVFAWAFTDETCPTHVTIPNSVTGICENAFYNCHGLKGVTIPEGVVRIGAQAFDYCRNLTELAIPNSVKQIDSSAFSDCRGLTEITIPNSVTNVGSSAFFRCEGLGSVTVPACVLETGLGTVFPACSSITNVVLSEGVREITHSAWGYSGDFPNLEHVFIPASVTNIDTEAFSVFRGRVAVTVDPANAVYSSRDGMLLTKDGTTLIQGVNGDVTIPPGVTSIDARAFYNCNGLTRVVIPNSVTNIGNSAFRNCGNLRNVWLPKHLKGKLSTSVFANCGSATLNYYDTLYVATFQTEEGVVEQRPCSAGTKVGTLPPTPTHEGYAFEGWWTAVDGEKATEKTVVTNDVTYYAKWRGTAAVGDYTYMYSVLNGQAEIGSSNTWEAAVSPKPTGAVVIPSTLDGYPVTAIGQYAFDVFGPTSFEIPEGVVNIRKFAFRYSSLTNVVIPSSVTGIHVWAFEFCDRLVNFTVDPANAVYSSRNGLLLSKDEQTLVRGVNGDVEIPSCVTEIGGSAFEGCRWLRSVVIPDGVLGIGTNAFQYCQALKNMMIPQSVTNIGTRAFTQCGNLMSFSVDPTNRFYSSRGGLLLSKDGTVLVQGINPDDRVMVPDGVITIGEAAFESCEKLESVELPGGVTTIGDSAFANCWLLTNVEIPDSVTTIGDLAFARCGSLTDVEIPVGVKNIGHSAFAGCRSLTNIEIPRGVTEIKHSAFYACTGLISRVVVPDSVTNIEWSSFAVCEGLKEVWLPRGLEGRFYPYEVFWGCDGALTLNYYDTPLHTIMFHSEEGADKWRLCPAGVTLGELPQLPSRAGAVFSGWWTEDGEPVFAGTVVTGDMTLEARWHVIAAPVITPADGTTFREGESCTVTITCADADAVIYYSTDGRTPHLTEAYKYMGPFTIDGTTTIRAVAVLDGVRSAYVAATLTQEIFMPQYHDERPDTDAVWLTFTTGGDAGWNYDWDWDNMDGYYDIRMQSGQIGNEEESWLQTSVVGRGTFSFRWKVDCEYDDFGEAAWDHLAVFTNGVEAVRMDGTQGWEKMSFTFDDDRRHTIRWVFVKDGSDEEDAAYEDSAWLGRFSWNPADVTVDAGKGRTVTVPGTWLGKRTVRAATDVAANGRKVWECYLLGCDSEKADDDFRIASFEVVDGVPAFTFSHTRDGSGVSFGPRIRILGKARLDDAAWTEMPEGGDPALRFFKAEVALP